MPNANIIGETISRQRLALESGLAATTRDILSRNRALQSGTFIAVARNATLANERQLQLAKVAHAAGAPLPLKQVTDIAFHSSAAIVDNLMSAQLGILRSIPKITLPRY